MADPVKVEAIQTGNRLHISIVIEMTPSHHDCSDNCDRALRRIARSIGKENLDDILSKWRREHNQKFHPQTGANKMGDDVCPSRGQMVMPCNRFRDLLLHVHQISVNEGGDNEGNE
jgi:hypothetical protein